MLSKQCEQAENILCLITDIYKPVQYCRISWLVLTVKYKVILCQIVIFSLLHSGLHKLALPLYSTCTDEGHCCSSETHSKHLLNIFIDYITGIKEESLHSLKIAVFESEQLKKNPQSVICRP